MWWQAADTQACKKYSLFLALSGAGVPEALGERVVVNLELGDLKRDDRVSEAGTDESEPRSAAAAVVARSAEVCGVCGAAR